MEVFLASLFGGIFRALYGWATGTKFSLAELDYGQLAKSLALGALTGTPITLALGWSPETGIVLGWGGAEAAKKALAALGVDL